MKCPECGTVASQDDLFCGECGAILSAVPPPEADAEPDAGPALTPGAPPMPQFPRADAQLAPPVVQSFPSDAAAVPDPRANWATILGIASLALSFASCLPVINIVSCLGPVAAIAAIVLGAMVKRDVEAKGGLEQDRKRAQQGW